jgi:hypothetical protein
MYAFSDHRREIPYVRDLTPQTVSDFEKYPGYNLKLDPSFARSNMEGAYESLDFPLLLRLLADWPERVVTVRNSEHAEFNAHLNTCRQLLNRVRDQDSLYAQTVLDAVAERLSLDDREEIGANWFRQYLGKLEKMQRVLDLDEPKKQFGVRKAIEAKDGLMLNWLLRNYGQGNTAAIVQCINFLVENGAQMVVAPDQPVSQSPLYATDSAFSHGIKILTPPISVIPARSP